MLIDRVIGAKIALSDHRSSEITYEELLRLATAVRRGGMLSGKAGLLTLHMGDGREGLSKLFRAAKESEVPLNTFLPTHVWRNGLRIYTGSTPLSSTEIFWKKRCAGSKPAGRRILPPANPRPAARQGRWCRRFRKAQTSAA